MKAGSDAPFAIGSDGTVFVNVTHLDGMKKPSEFLELAVEQGALFIGVSLEPDEINDALERLKHGATEAVAYVIGGRLREERQRGAP